MTATQIPPQQVVDRLCGPGFLAVQLYNGMVYRLAGRDGAQLVPLAFVRDEAIPDVEVIDLTLLSRPLAEKGRDA